MGLYADMDQKYGKNWNSPIGRGPAGFSQAQSAPQNNQTFVGPRAGLRRDSSSGNNGVVNFVMGMNQRVVNMAMNPRAMLNQFQNNINGQRQGNQGINQGQNQGANVDPQVQQLKAERQVSKAQIPGLKTNVEQIGHQLGDATRGLAKAQSEMNGLKGQDSKNTLVAVRRLALQAEIQKFQAEVNKLKEAKAEAVQKLESAKNHIVTIDAQIAQINRHSHPIA